MPAGRTARSLAVLGAASATLLAVAPSAAAVSLEQIGTYSQPTFVTSDPGDADRILVVEQDGRIMLTEGGSTTEFLDMDAAILSIGEPDADNEHGLLSIAFAPDYGTSGRFYVLYTAPPDGEIHVDELTASGDVADDATAVRVITLPQTGDPNHNGGQLQFGPDGYLYMSVGDGDCCGDPLGSGQDLESLWGKLLRIAPTPGGGYTVPPDNPFVGVMGVEDEIWSYGLRNPWRFSFDRMTGALLVADVGDNAWEELDYEPASAGGGKGDNFGWNCREGPDPLADCPGSFTEPVFSYPHAPGACSITGGYVVRDPQLPELAGRYVYADFCGGEIRSLTPALPNVTDDRAECLDVAMPTSFGEDAAGRVYAVSRAGPVYRLVSGGPGCAGPPAQPPAQPPEREPPLDGGVGPDLALAGNARQGVGGGRRISLTASASEDATIEVRGGVFASAARRGLFDLPSVTADVRQGAVEKITWRLTRKQAREARRRIRRGRRVIARFDGSATGSGGIAGPPVTFEVRLARPR